MNLIGLNCTYSYNEEKDTPANIIHTLYPLFNRMEENYDHPDQWILILSSIGDNAVCILNEVYQNTNSCRDIRGNLIDRHTVNEELQILAKDINKINNFIYGLLKRKPQLDKSINYFNQGLASINEQCAKLRIQADEMIFKSVQHSDHKKEELLLLAAKLDDKCPLNNIPKELINIFATTMFEVKLNDAQKACTAT